MSTDELFVTKIYRASLGKSTARLNEDLLDEVEQLVAFDEVGREWSEENYVGGYTSYSSQSDLHLMSSTFRSLEEKISKHVDQFVRDLYLDLGGRELRMTDCWANVMGPGTSHSSHIHPLSCISGTYYAQVPEGASGILFEDPRLSSFMGAPPRKRSCPKALKPHVTVKTRSGMLVLFESWLRHEVPASACEHERISISFNYGWD